MAKSSSHGKRKFFDEIISQIPWSMNNKKRAKASARPNEFLIDYSSTCRDPIMENLGFGLRRRCFNKKKEKVTMCNI